MPASPTRRLWLVAGATAFVVALVLSTRLDQGLWSAAEAEPLRRVLGHHGVPLFDLERAPYLDVALRSLAAKWWGDPTVGMRLPGLVAVSLTVALTVAFARRGATWRDALLAGGVALALPLSGFGGTLAVGRPVGELAITAAIWLGTLEPRGSRASELARWTAIATVMVGAVAHVGLALGLVLPAITLAAVEAGRTRHRLSMGWVAIATLSGLLAWGLVANQGPGFVPALADAQDATLFLTPHLRPFATGLDDASAQLFPWLPLALAGALLPGSPRVYAVWWVVGLVAAETWGHWYGTVPMPVTVPTAILSVRGLTWLADQTHPGPLRRATTLLVVIGLLIVGKNASLAPQLFGSPLAPIDAALYPADAIGTGDQLGRSAKVAALAVFVVAGGGRLSAAMGRSARPEAIAAAAVGLLCAWQLRTTFGALLPTSTARLSPAPVAETYAARIDRYQLPRTVGRFRVHDPALAHVLPDEVITQALADRRALLRWLGSDELRTAWLPQTELAAAFAGQRARGHELSVLDDRHIGMLVVANQAVDGLADLNPLADLVSSTRPQLEHETYVRFGDAIEVVGWQIDGSLVRTRQVTITLALHVLKRVPKRLKITTRLVRGRLSRIRPYPHEPTQGHFAPKHWRRGDYVLDRMTFTVPPLEIMSGEHELEVGMRTSRHMIYDVTKPDADEPSEHGVTIGDRKGRFAVLGRVRVY
ncbi:MAG: hypothetical protein B7733_06525 [Myxococcales bacterium FL481]|nr:MAG: hypothetical protein B7733_06525 [Myxococcales bacterium FL481]